MTILPANSDLYIQVKIVSPSDPAGGFPIIAYEHHEIHEGDHYSAHHSKTGMGDGDKTNICFRTSDSTKQIHALYNLTGTGAAYFRVKEGGTASDASGTDAQVIFNNNRLSSNTSSLLDKAAVPAVGKYSVDVTSDLGSTTIHEEYGGAAKAVGANFRATNELILKSDCLYIFEGEADAGPIILHIDLSWYEHGA